MDRRAHYFQLRFLFLFLTCLASTCSRYCVISEFVVGDAVQCFVLGCQECLRMILRYQCSATHDGPDPYTAGMYSELIPAICFPGYQLALMLRGLAPPKG